MSIFLSVTEFVKFQMIRYVQCNLKIPNNRRWTGNVFFNFRDWYLLFPLQITYIHDFCYVSCYLTVNRNLKEINTQPTKWSQSVILLITIQSLLNYYVKMWDNCFHYMWDKSICSLDKKLHLCVRRNLHILTLYLVMLWALIQHLISSS